MNVAVVIPNWNGKDRIGPCLDSLLAQSLKLHIIVVENGSIDGSLEFIEKNYPMVELVVNQKNLGFAGGVNGGILRAKELGFEFVALLNNDAVADKNWVKHLLKSLEADKKLGAAACKILSADKKYIDTTGDSYSTWGLTISRQRDIEADKAVSVEELVFGACAGAAMYRISMFDEVGMFDEDFFAYFEDSDLNFRMQTAGWKVLYNPKAVTYHATGSTGGSIKGFHTHQTFQNLPLLYWKNMPLRLVPKTLPRFSFVYGVIFLNSFALGRGWPATKGFFRMLILLPKKLIERRRIQKSRKVSVEYIDSILYHDLPPNADKLRRLRSIFTFGRH